MRGVFHISILPKFKKILNFFLNLGVVLNCGKHANRQSFTLLRKLLRMFLEPAAELLHQFPTDGGPSKNFFLPTALAVKQGDINLLYQ